MTFEEILDQAIAMLQRRGRLTYRTLQLQFQLDDAHLAALKDELLYSQPHVVDDVGRGLVWTADTDMPSTLSPSPPLPVPAERPHAQTVPGAPPPVAPRAVDAERRQLTVMFCDLVESTKLSSQLDPEEYREVVRAYQSACTEVIQHYDGHIAQLLGDGLLVYFGYPQAHEDDAQRAVRAGLGILNAMGVLNQRLPQAKGIQLSLRMGIHTGLVVVGEMGGAGRQEQLALGEVPNLAARLQGLAESNTVVISDATSRLVQGYFECQDVGAQTLRGVAEPVQVYCVLQESGARGRLDVAVTRGLTPLVGREQEVGLLVERWEQVKAGQGQVVLLTGDAGIGKSRLVQMLKDHVADEPYIRWECRNSEYYQNTALFPLVDLFQRILRFEAHETPEEKFGKLEHALSQYRVPLEESVQLFAPLLSVPIPENPSPPLNLSSQRQRQKTLETIVAILLDLAERQPVLLIIEDLHWTDPSTLELLNLVLDQTPTASVLVLLTCRPTFQLSWSHRSYLTEITVNRLSQPQIKRMTAHVAGDKPLSQEVCVQIADKTDGVPLFVEEITKAILESGHLKEVDGHYHLTGSLPSMAIPTTLQDALMARLDRLVTAKAVAQYAAVIGRQFAYDLLSTVSQLDAATLQRELGRLVEAEIVYQRGVPPQATYTFKHALIQDAAYESLLKSTRQQYHQRIAQVLEAQFPDTALLQPELVAHHYTEAGLSAHAVLYWQQAGQRAVERSAYAEAITHLSKGLAVLKTLSDTPERLQQELDLQLALGPALVVIRGPASPAVAQAYARAQELCQQVGETPQRFRVLWGLWRFYNNRAEYQRARALGERLLRLAQQVHDAALLLEAHHALWATLLGSGEFASARAHLEQGRGLYDPQQHHAHARLYGGHDPGVCGLSHAALSLWILGYPDQALQSLREALTLAQALAHPPSLAPALDFATMQYQSRREHQAVHERAEALMALATEQGFAQHVAQATIMRGWALAAQGQGAEGTAPMRQGLAAHQATGSARQRPYYPLLAEAYGSIGQTAEGLSLLAETLATVDRPGERGWEAELHRLQGALLLAQAGERPQVPEAEACLHQALDVARRQQAKSWELRAATSLSRLWQQQGKRAEAHALLAPIYGWFTEGFDTADLQEAKALLEALT
jgi:class 3 adenylate cyclase/predicted ATPase/energy-coupling factor transporter ATP-binding protein EcfA2